MKSINPYALGEFAQVDVLDRALSNFPFLGDVDKVYHESLKEVAFIIDRLATYTYESKSKYECMWDVIRLGSLLDKILPKKITDGVTLKTLVSASPDIKLCSGLSEQQQWSLFKITKNVCSDFFHLIYEEPTKKFLEQVTMLCQGQNVSLPLVGMSQQYTKYSRGKDIEKLLKNNQPMQVRLFNQTGYFLVRASEFVNVGNIPAANMALLGACNCARFVFISKVKGEHDLELMTTLFEMRKLLSHTDLSEGQEKERLAIIKSTCSNLDSNVLKLEKDARILGLASDVQTYKKVEKPTDDSESPRGFPKGLF